MSSPVRANESEEAFAKSIHYLKFRPRSRQEINDYLKKKGYSGTAVYEALRRLEQYRYVNDEEFARIWIENRNRNRPRGEFALRSELKQKGVSEEIIERILSGFDEFDPAWREVLSRLKRWKVSKIIELKKKVYDHLRRRGFSYETCEKVYKQAADYIGK